MKVELLYFEGCPNWQAADARLREALAPLGRGTVTVTHQVVWSPEQAERVGFRGSPTILVDGTDPFAQADDPVGFTCRLYRDDDHVPTVEQMRVVLSGGRADRDVRAGGLAALVVAGLTLCCALPAALSLAVGITLGGIGLPIWLAVAGAIVAVAGFVGWRRRHGCADRE